MKIKLGDMVKDSTTGFSGVVVGRTEWLHSADRLAVQSGELHEGKPVDEQWFYEPELERLGKTKIKKEMKKPAKRGRKPKAEKE